jgi:hypothetical protein
MPAGVGPNWSFSPWLLCTWTLSTADSELSLLAQSSMTTKVFTACRVLLLCHTPPCRFYQSCARPPERHDPTVQLGCRIRDCLARHTVEDCSRSQDFTLPAPETVAVMAARPVQTSTSSPSISKKICGGLVAPTSKI